jgi:hypothetical protein
MLAERGMGWGEYGVIGWYVPALWEEGQLVVDLQGGASSSSCEELLLQVPIACENRRVWEQSLCLPLEAA